MTGDIRVPGNLEIPVCLFGKFTIKELARLSIPPAAGLVTASIPGLVTGVVLGLIWYLWKPYGKPLDHLLVNLPRWFFGKHQNEGTDLGKIETSLSSSEVVDGKIKNKYGSFIGVVAVTPTNLDLKTGAERAALHRVYQELLEKVNYPITVHSQQKQFEFDQYLTRLENCSCPDNALKEDYQRYCGFLAETELADTQHFITVRVDPSEIQVNNKLEQFVKKAPPTVEHWLSSTLNLNLEDSAEAQAEALTAEVDSRCREIADIVTTTDLSAEQVTNFDKISELVTDNLQTEPGTTPLWTSHPTSGEYKKTLYISEYPSTVEFGWINQLLQVSGKVDTAQIITPAPTSGTVSKLERLSEKLNAEISSFLASGYTGTNKLESLLNDVEWFLDLLADRKAQPVQYGCYITVHSTDRGRCQQVFDQVCNRLDTMRFDYQQPILQTDLAYQTISPLYGDPLNESLLMPASSAASGFPFTTQQSTENGILTGVDQSTGAPVLLDRFNWSSHSLARMGMVGSGKSYMSKLELLRSHLIYTDLQIIVVDPKQEYQGIIEACNGTYRTLSDKTSLELDQDVIGYTVPERGDEKNTELLTDAVRQIYQQVSQDQRKTLVLIDEARILLNHPDGLDVLNQFVLEGRDTNTAVTLVTQNASHFTHSRKGREILDNMPGKVFLRHDRVPDSVVNYFDLSRREKQKLYELKTGTESPYSEALLRVSGQLKTRVKIEATGQEDAVIKQKEVSNP